jgi:hypothetical protein
MTAQTTREKRAAAARKRFERERLRGEYQATVQSMIRTPARGNDGRAGGVGK